MLFFFKKVDVPIFCFMMEKGDSFLFLDVLKCSRGAPIGSNDLIIAATVIAHHGTLITCNTKEFNRVPDIKLRNL